MERAVQALATKERLPLEREQWHNTHQMFIFQSIPWPSSKCFDDLSEEVWLTFRCKMQNDFMQILIFANLKTFVKIFYHESFTLELLLTNNHSPTVTVFTLTTALTTSPPPLSLQVEVCPILPEPLQHVRKRVYSRYKQLSLREGQHTLQFTKVAVLQNAPKPRRQGDPDQGEFLKQYRDCGVRLSEGAEQVTVNHFLHKGSHQTRIIYGQPGTGKTTFLKHLCQKVASDEPSDFSLVFYFPLRDKAVSEALKDDSDAGLAHLMQYCIRGKMCSASAEALLESEGENVLIIFDGADEVRGLMDSPDGSLLGALLEGRVLPQAHFIVSTRPGGCPLLQQHSTLFYEILGFDKEAVESYVKEFFKSEPGKGEAMLSDLRARPDLMGGVYVPMNLLIFCSIYEHGVAGRSAFPATMTECYTSSIAKTVTREKQKVKSTYRVDPSLTDLPPDVKQLLSSLGVLAFNGLTQEPPHYIFQEREVRDAFRGTVKHDETLDDSTFAGLLHLHPDQDGISSTLNFSHTTKQEYFTAYHLSLLPEAEQAAFWRKNRHNPKFAVVLKFAAGLTKFKSPIVSEAILPTGGGLPSDCDTANPYLLYVFHALFESQNESLTQSIATQLNNCLNFNLYLTPFDTMALSHCLTQCDHLTELHTINYSLPPTSFHHVYSVVQSNPLQSLSLRVEQFSTEGE